MKCDGCIEEPNSEIRVIITCSVCNNTVYNNIPISGHKNCLRPDGRLAVKLEIINYKEE